MQPTPEPKRDPRFRIFLVDDAPNLRQSASALITSLGFSTPEAVDGSERLLQRLAEDAMNVVLLDVQLDTRKEPTIRAFHESFRQRFPKAALTKAEPPKKASHQDLLLELGLAESDTVSGKYLVPFVKALQPKAYVVLLTNEWVDTDYQTLKTWGMYDASLKMVDDSNSNWLNRAKTSGLGNELRNILDTLYREWSGPIPPSP